MSDRQEERRALRPLWLVATGATVAATASVLVSIRPPPILGWSLIAIGGAAFLAALAAKRWWALWLLAGLALVGGRGLLVRADRIELERLLAGTDQAALRVRVTVLQGWSPSRWGVQNLVSVQSARHGDRELTLPGVCRLEVRGGPRPHLLPPPGAAIEGLVSVRGEARRPLLVASSPRLLTILGPPAGLAHLRQRLVQELLEAAGTNPRRIRAAELAASLSLGRRDLMPADRRQGWRRSGLAHLLAVSGLHVGMVAAIVWLIPTALGCRPRTARIALLVALPGYALLAGAAPSAVRAALMGVVYVAARMLGRALLPMAAVLLVAVALLFVRPELVTEPGFQLTVLITAALVRWVPVLVDRLPGPRWLTGLLAVPLVAQTAAAPIVAWHFRTVVPGAAAVNMLVPPLLAPTLVTTLAATAVAPLWPWAAARLLDLVALWEQLLWSAGSIGRAAELLVPTTPAVAAALLAAAGWLALQVGRRGKVGAVIWLALMALVAGWWWLRPAPSSVRVELLPVADGLAVTVDSGGSALLVDGGRRSQEAALLLTDAGIRELEAVVVSHTDEDHLAGAIGVVRGLGARRLVAPGWMISEPATVPLLRAARRKMIPVIATGRGSVVRVGPTTLEVLWPPVGMRLPEVENERSLVARLRIPDGTVLITSDVGSATEARIARSSSLACSVLVVPHHGSRRSSSSLLLAAARPEVALIPAAPDNRYNHPHPEVLERFAARGIPVRYPARDGRCGARYADGRWVPYP